MTIISKDIRLAVRILRKGGIIAYPTESSYALGCDAANAKAARRIYAMKKRPENKQLTLIVGSLKAAEKYAVLDKTEKKIAGKLMPGRLTLVVKAKGGGEFAFRIPANKVALELAKAFGKPITATSANISGEKPIYSVKKLLSLYDKKINMILDGRNLPKRKASTVADVFSGVNIRRKGPVSKKQIEDVI